MWGDWGLLHLHYKCSAGGGGNGRQPLSPCDDGDSGDIPADGERRMLFSHTVTKPKVVREQYLDTAHSTVQVTVPLVGKIITSCSRIYQLGILRAYKKTRPFCYKHQLPKTSTCTQKAHYCATPVTTATVAPLTCGQGGQVLVSVWPPRRGGRPISFSLNHAERGSKSP